MGTCKHDFDLKDAFSDKSALKVPICKLCGEIGKVIIQSEKKEEKEPTRDMTMGTMCALKCANETEIHNATIRNVVVNTADVEALTKKYESIIYRKR